MGYFKMNLENIKLDLWVLFVLVLLIPEKMVSTTRGSVETQLPLFLLGIGIICLTIWLLKRCGVLIKYRYLLIKLNCTVGSKTSKRLSISLMFLAAPAYGYIIFLTPIMEFILQFSYLLLCILLSLSFEDGAQTYKNKRSD